MKRIFFFALLIAFALGANAASFQDGRGIGTHWTFDEYQFPDNFTIVGIPQLNGEVLQSAYLEIGAFCGDECRGSFLPNQMTLPGGAMYFHMMQVYGQNGDQITFRIYDHQTEQELDVDCSNLITFMVNDNYGTPIEPYVFEFFSSFSVSAVANPTVGGTVSGSGIYQYGSTCSLSATANTGYTFINWTRDGTVVSNVPNFSFTVTEAGDYVANFELNSYDVTVTAEPEEGGTVAGGGTFAHGTSCTLTAVPNPDYVFLYWTKDEEVVSIEPTYSFSVTEAGDYVGHFSIAYHWDVNIYEFPNSMTMVGIIQIDGVEQFSHDLELGAFCNNQCRGCERPVLESAFGRYFLYLTLYGNDGDRFNFRLYDHATDEEVGKYCLQTIVFETNGSIGTVMEPYVFNFTDTQTHTTHLSPGWNWYSTYIDLAGIDGLTMMEEGLGSYGQTIKSQGDGYDSYMEGFGWYGSLSSINNSSSYQLRLTEECDLNMTGLVAHPSDYPITLNNGWSWIGYPTVATMNIDDAFVNYTPQSGDMLKTQNNGYASYLDGFGWYGSLNTLLPGMGMMYKSVSITSTTFCYPEVRSMDVTVKNLNVRDNHWVPNLSAYPDNMCIMAVVELGDMELRSEQYELAAFADGECRGSVKLAYVEPLDRYIAFLTVAGDEAAELYFGLYDAETGVAEAQCFASLQYETNAVVGSFAEPYVIRFRGTTGVDEWANSLQIYPNPVTRGQRVSLNVADAEVGEVQIAVINAIGVVVETLRATSQRAPIVLKAPDQAGIYTLRIIANGKESHVQKLVVK